MTVAASPQLEDGYTRIANELLSAIWSMPFTHQQHKVIFAVIQKTYGFNKKEDDVSASQLGSFCSMKRENVTRTLNELVKMNVITKKPGAYGSIVGLQKDYKKWVFPSVKSTRVDSVRSTRVCQLDTSVKSTQGVSNPTVASVKSTQVDSVRSTHTKDNLPKDNQQKRTTSAPSEKISLNADGGWDNIPDTLKSVWAKAYPAISLDTELSKAAAWILSNPKNKKSNYSRFLTNWLTRAQDSAPRAGKSNSSGDWWVAAGFDNPYEAENAGCTERTAYLWREGKRLEATA